MKIGIFTDIHLHKYATFSGTDGKQRLRDGLEILRYVIELFVKKRCSALIFIGDLFHIRRVLDIEVFNETRQTLASLPLDRFDFKFAVTGNHDWYDQGGIVSSLEFLTEFGFVVVTDGRIVNLENIELVLLPWMPKEKLALFLDHIGEKPKYRKRLLFVHTIPFGSSSATGHVFRAGINLSDYAEYFDQIFCGDIHKRQRLGSNVLICGAPMHHNFGDVGQERGVHIYDSELDKCEFISLQGKYPEFIVAFGKDVKPTDTKNYYRIVTGDIDKFVNMNNVQIIHVKEREVKRRADVSTVTSPGKAIEEYAKRFCGSMKVDKLIRIGKEALS